MKIKLLKITQIAKDTLNRVLLTLTNVNVNTLTAVQYGASGDDSPPIKSAIGAYAGTEMDGKNICVGVMTKGSKARSGEKRLYATDENGVFKFVLWLRDDGTVLQGDSDVPAEYTNFATKYNELKLDLDALKQSLNSLVAAFNVHVHPTAATGSPSPPTPVPSQIPVTPNTTDFSNIKHEKIKYK